MPGFQRNPGLPDRKLKVCRQADLLAIGILHAGIPLCRYPFSYRQKTVIGLIDSDGSYNLRLTKRKNGKLGCAVSVSLKQKAANDDVLKILKAQLKSKTKVITLSTSYTTKKGQQKQKTGSNFGIALSTKPGQKLCDMLKKFQPLSPSKRKDYLLSQHGLQFIQTRRVKSYIDDPTLTNDQNETVCSVALAVLFYNTSMNTSLNFRGLRKGGTSKLWVDSLNASFDLKKRGFSLAKKVLKEIKRKVDQLKEGLVSGKIRVPNDYIIGFHIGDGCFSFSYFYSKKGKLMLDHYWSVKEFIDSEELLVGIKNTLKVGSLSKQSKDNTRNLTVRSISNLSSIIIPLFDRYFLPAARQKQFICAKKTCELIGRQRYKTELGFKLILEASYDMNQSSRPRGLTKQELLEKHKFYRENFV